MKRGLIGLVVVVVAVGVICSFCPDNVSALVATFDENYLRRGDVNGDGTINISDPVMLDDYLFNGGEPPVCLDACDANSDGGVNITDVIFLLDYLFDGGPEPVGMVYCD